MKRNYNSPQTCVITCQVVCTLCASGNRQSMSVGGTANPGGGR